MSNDIDLMNSALPAVHLHRLMDGQKVFKTFNFLFLVTLNNIDNVVFECCMLVFTWERFGLKSFRNYTSLSPCKYSNVRL